MADPATYRAIWPVTDATRPPMALVAEAAAGLDAMARADGARIVGEPRWTVTKARVVCEVPAVPLQIVDGSSIPILRDAEVVRLRELGWTVRQVAEVMGMPSSTVQNVLKRHGMTHEEGAAA